MKRSLNVAISTDTILYAPFYLAYFGNDFDDTPFGPVDVRIVGLDDDRFDSSKKLRGDNFVVLSLLFDYADVGIGDPSILIDLSRSPKKHIPLVEDFSSFLQEDEKKKFMESFEIPAIIRDPDLDKFSGFLKEKDLKIVGGLVSKLAFIVVGNNNLIPSHNSDPPHEIGGIFGALMPDAEKSIKKIISYDYPSTGFCIGKIINNQIPTQIEFKHKDFGQELSNIDKNQISISCDFVAINKRASQNEFVSLEDYIAHSSNITFTGIMARNNDNKIQQIKAFLWAIDKNLHEIFQYINQGDKNGMKMYFQERLKRHKDFKQVLVADSEFAEDSSNDISKLINTFIDNLFKWKRKSSKYLFYSTVKPISLDICRMYNIRLRSASDDELDLKNNENESMKIIDSYIKNLSSDWDKIQELILNRKDKWWWKVLLKDQKSIFYTSTLIIIIGIVSTILSIFDWKFPIKFHYAYIILVLVIFIPLWYIINSAYHQKYEKYVYKDLNQVKTDNTKNKH